MNICGKGAPTPKRLALVTERRIDRAMLEGASRSLHTGGAVPPRRA
jgi:hypothetical protein